MLRYGKTFISVNWQEKITGIFEYFRKLQAFKNVIKNGTTDTLYTKK